MATQTEGFSNPMISSTTNALICVLARSPERQLYIFYQERAAISEVNIREIQRQTYLPEGELSLVMASRFLEL